MDALRKTITNGAIVKIVTAVMALILTACGVLGNQPKVTSTPQVAATMNAVATSVSVQVTATAAALESSQPCTLDEVLAASEEMGNEEFDQFIQGCKEIVQQSASSDPIALLRDAAPYMSNYAATLSYTVPAELQVSADLVEGFYPVASLVMTTTVYPNGYEVVVPPPPANVDAYACFPQDYSESDMFNPGCGELQANGKLPWTKPIASYGEGDNWSCVDVTGWCADATDAFHWDMWNGETVCHPAVGCLRNPNPKGAVSLLLINFHDSDEAWDVRNGSGVYVTAGWAGMGVMFDLTGESYDVGDGIAALRNHYLYNLSNNEAYPGQCGDSKLCESVLYVVVGRFWDRPELGINYSHYELLSAGLWER